MGILDIFKNNNKDKNFPDNELERILMQATNDPDSRKEFYQKLLWSPLFFMTTKDLSNEAELEVEDNMISIPLVAFDDGEIPIFTSVSRIYDKGVIKEKPHIANLKGQDLFDTFEEVTFILNPFSDYSKELWPEEVQSILDGSIYDTLDRQVEEDQKIAKFSEIYDRACHSQEGLMLLDGESQKELNEPDKQKLENSITDFQECLNLFPDHWQSMLLMAKSLQRLDRHAEALEQLEAAMELEEENHTVPLEASAEALALKDLEKALRYSEESLRRAPDHPALLSNHAMNLLLAGDDKAAKKNIDRAIELDPRDRISQNVERMISDTIAGKRARPTIEELIKS